MCEPREPWFQVPSRVVTHWARVLSKNELRIVLAFFCLGFAPGDGMPEGGLAEVGAKIGVDRKGLYRAFGRLKRRGIVRESWRGAALFYPLDLGAEPGEEAEEADEE